MSFFKWLFSLFHHSVHNSKPSTSVFNPMSGINPMQYLAKHSAGEAPWTDRLIDYGRFQIDDTFKLDDTHAITAWSYAPFGAWDASHGDGGERYTVSGDTVCIDSTQDGGTPGVQSFGTGWIAFKTDADGSWRDAHTLIGLSPVYTRYTRTPITFPELGTLDCIVSEHYSGTDAASSTAMERTFFAKGYGRICWQAWERTGGQAVSADRAPDFGWNSLPGWVLTDTRVCVNPITTAPVNGAMLWRP